MTYDAEDAARAPIMRPSTLAVPPMTPQEAELFEQRFDSWHREHLRRMGIVGIREHYPTVEAR